MSFTDKNKEFKYTYLDVTLTFDSTGTIWMVISTSAAGRAGKWRWNVANGELDLWVADPYLSIITKWLTIQIKNSYVAFLNNSIVE